MRLDVTLQRQSKFIVGIVVVVFASFFVAFALAVGGLSEHSPSGFELIGVGLDQESNLKPNDNLEPEGGNDNLVPVALRYEVGPFDTVPGEIELLDFNFPYYDKATGELLPLPLCITNEMSSTWWFDLKVTGGYTPEDTLGYWPWMGISFWQDQDKDGTPEMIQGWNLEYQDITDCLEDPCCCTTSVWRGTPAWCGNTVCLDSNQYPALTGGLEYFNNEYLPNDQTEIPGKEVYVKIGLLYSGCPLDEQQFAYILAQKRWIFPQNPRLPDGNIR